MIKKIPCRVVRTASLSKSSDASRHASRSNNKHYKASDVVAVDVQVMPAVSEHWRDRHSTSSSVTDPKAHNLASGTVTYTGQSGTARVSIDNAPTGQILDCYA